MLITQRKHFKLKERDFEKNLKVSSFFKKNDKISQNPQKHLSPLKNSKNIKENFIKLYEMEKSDNFRRLRTPICLIMKENKFNGHNSLYTRSLDSRPFEEITEIKTRKEHVDRKKEENTNFAKLQRELVSEMKIHSTFLFKYISFFTILSS